MFLYLVCSRFIETKQRRVKCFAFHFTKRSAVHFAETLPHAVSPTYAYPTLFLFSNNERTTKPTFPPFSFKPSRTINSAGFNR